jgi:hypothetical protein
LWSQKSGLKRIGNRRFADRTDLAMLLS